MRGCGDAAQGETGDYGDDGDNDDDSDDDDKEIDLIIAHMIKNSQFPLLTDICEN